jgi:hypothetical protein
MRVPPIPFHFLLFLLLLSHFLFFAPITLIFFPDLEFWGLSLQDGQGTQMSVKEIVGNRTTLFIYIDNFGR